VNAILITFHNITAVYTNNGMMKHGMIHPSSNAKNGKEARLKQDRFLAHNKCQIYPQAGHYYEASKFSLLVLFVNWLSTHNA